MNDTQVKTSSTADVLVEMLTENTGRHMLDSGGAYGRHWEGNQGRNFDAEPAATVKFESYGDRTEIMASVNVYHWLLENLEYNPEMDDRLGEFAQRPGMEDEHWLTIMEAFPAHLRRNGEHQVAGLYGDGDPFTTNTYNGDCLLSQTLQFLYLEVDGLAMGEGCPLLMGVYTPIFSSSQCYFNKLISKYRFPVIHSS